MLNCLFQHNFLPTCIQNFIILRISYVSLRKILFSFVTFLLTGICSSFSNPELSNEDMQKQQENFERSIKDTKYVIFCGMIFGLR